MKGTFINLTYWEFIIFLIGYKWTNISSDLPWQRSTAWRDVSTLLWACLHSSNRILITIWVYLSSRFFKELRLCFVHSRIHRQTLCKAGYVTQASALTCATWMDSKSACKVRNTSFGRGGGIFTESEKSSCQTKHSQRVWPVLTTFVWPDFFTETSRLGIVENGMLIVLWYEFSHFLHLGVWTCRKLMLWREASVLRN